MRLIKINEKKIIEAAININKNNALKPKNTIGYMPRILVNTTLPHSNPLTSRFERINGRFSLTLSRHDHQGLPYGVYPRLLLTWIATQAVKQRSQALPLGKNFTAFMKNVGITPSGGPSGTVVRLRQQIQKLLHTHLLYQDKSHCNEHKSAFRITEKRYPCMTLSSPLTRDTWPPTLELDRAFYQEIIYRPVPIDMRAFKALRLSSLAMDLYCWLTYRLSYLRHRTEVPWHSLQPQFGANYAVNTSGRYAFKKKFKEQLRKVLTIYNTARVEEGKYGLLLRPSQPHVSRRQ